MEAQGAQAHVRTRLRDGTPIVLRPVGPADREELAWGVRNLSPRSRYRRFFSPVADLDERQLRYFTEIDYRDHFAWGASLDQSDLEHPGIGVARYVRLRERPEAADFAVVVLDDWQGRGCGSLLLGAVLLAAEQNGIAKAVGEVLRENEPMLSLLRYFGADLRPGDPGEVVATFEVASRAGLLRGHPWDQLREVARAVSAGVREPDP